MSTAQKAISRAEMLKLSLLKYPINPETVKARPGQRNLHELIRHFPGQGKNMRVFRKDWPENTYYHIQYVRVGKQNNPKYYAVKYTDGELSSHKFERIKGAQKRGIWQFDINDAFELTEEEIIEMKAKEAKSEANVETKNDDEKSEE